MAEQIKQRFNAKAEISLSEIEETDIGIMTHRPDNLEGGDRKFKFGTLFLWIKEKLSEIFSTKKELENSINGLNEIIEEKADKRNLGDLPDLETTEKESLVGAVNEVNSNLNKKADKPIDKVEFSNMNAVTSNAVANEIKQLVTKTTSGVNQGVFYIGEKLALIWGITELGVKTINAHENTGEIRINTGIKFNGFKVGLCTISGNSAIYAADPFYIEEGVFGVYVQNSTGANITSKLAIKYMLIVNMV